MAQVAAQRNPYAAREEIVNSPVEYTPPQTMGEFAAPPLEAENGIMDSPIGAYADGLRAEPGGTPDPHRLGTLTRRDRRPFDGRAPEEFWRGLDADDAARHHAETQDADGFEIIKEGSGKPAAPNPRATPPPEPRPTSRLSPRTYTFLRNLWGGPQRLNGEHFSMADHRRDYPVGGIAPVRSWRNTFRIEPTPYDVDMVDLPPDTTPISARIQSVEVPASATRNWRL